MKLTTEQIKQLIKEELQKLIDEGVSLTHRSRDFDVLYKGKSVKVIPLRSAELAKYKSEGFLKDKEHIGSKGGADLVGFYEVKAIDKPGSLYSAAESKVGNPGYSYLVVLDDPNVNKVANLFATIKDQLNISLKTR